MKKLVCILALTLLSVSSTWAQCTFSGLAPSYCASDPAVTLTASVPGGQFSGPGITGSNFNPTLAGPGTHTITYGICTSTYALASIPFSTVSTTGNVVSSWAGGNSDDGYTSNFPIGFSFQFFCNTYTDFYLCTNGWMSFTQNSVATYPGQTMPNSAVPNNIIAGVWSDLNFTSAGVLTYTTIGTAPNRKLIVSYTNVPYYSSGNPVTFQIQLYESTNVIEIHSTSVPTDGNNRTMGIEDSGGNNAYPVTGRNANNTWTATNDAYRWTPGSSCATSQTTTVKTASISITSVDTTCSGDNITLTANGNVTYTWTSPSSNLASVNVAPLVTTIYTVSGTNTLSCVSMTTKSIVVKPLPNINTVVSPTMLCVGNTATITASGANTYTWQGTGPNTSTFTANPAVTTTYSIAATGINHCYNYSVVTVNVSTLVLSVSANTAICLGSSITLTTTGAHTNNYLWNGSTPFAQVTVTPAITTTYSVTAVDMYNCNLSGAVTVSVNSLPSATITANRLTICKGEKVNLTAGGGPNLTGYLWNNAATSVSISPTLTVDIVYTFSVTVTDAHGCKNTATINITVNKCSGLTELTENFAVDIFPNPGNGVFTVRSVDVKPNSNIEVYNALGSLIKVKKMTANETTINLEQEENGIYFIRIVENTRVVQVSKLIKE